MVKKRERRRADPSSESTSQTETVDNSSSLGAEPDRKRSATITTIKVLFLFVIPVISVILYFPMYAPNTDTAADRPYIYRRGLVRTDINYRQILYEHMKTSGNSSQRNFDNPVLAYITPWNSKGYDMAKKFNNKFTHLSPVWYQLKSQGTELILEGRHNADKGWIAEIRSGGNALILPRVVLEAIPVDLLKKKRKRNKAVNLIIAECKEMEYDGIVLESWSLWAAYGVLHDPDMRNMALQFIKQLGQAMHSVKLERDAIQNLQLVYVIGPSRSNELQEHDFGPEDLQSLSNDVDGFSLMTYDFSGPQNPGPNAPIKWIHSTLLLLLDADAAHSPKLAKKIFIGINFYGNDFAVSGGLGGGPILGREYLSLLERHNPQLQWEKNSAEHFFLYMDDQNVKHVVFYPSLMSISMRLQEALTWGAGISIWEIGQGLEYFFDML